MNRSRRKQPTNAATSTSGTVGCVTWVSHSAALDQYHIGRETLRRGAECGLLREQTRDGANGQRTRLVDTDELDALGYRRKPPVRSDEERPFVEERLDSIESDMSTIVKRNEELATELNELRVMFVQLLHTLETMQEAERTPPPRSHRPWMKRLRQHLQVLMRLLGSEPTSL